MNKHEVLKYKLRTLESHLADDIDSDEFDVGYEDEAGSEFFEPTSIVAVAAESLTYIEELEAKLASAESRYAKLDDLANEVVYFGKKNPCSVPSCVQDLVDFYVESEDE